MAKSVWVKTKTIYCDRVKDEVYLMEERVFPSDELALIGEQYHIRAQKCSEGLDCNLDGYRCKYSGLNPNYDPFADK